MAENARQTKRNPWWLLIQRRRRKQVQLRKIPPVRMLRFQRLKVCSPVSFDPCSKMTSCSHPKAHWTSILAAACLMKRRVPSVSDGLHAKSIRCMPNDNLQGDLRTLTCFFSNIAVYMIQNLSSLFRRSPRRRRNLVCRASARMVLRRRSGRSCEKRSEWRSGKLTFQGTAGTGGGAHGSVPGEWDSMDEDEIAELDSDVEIDKLVSAVSRSRRAGQQTAVLSGYSLFPPSVVSPASLAGGGTSTGTKGGASNTAPQTPVGGPTPLARSTNTTHYFVGRNEVLRCCADILLKALPRPTNSVSVVNPSSSAVTSGTGNAVAASASAT